MKRFLKRLFRKERKPWPTGSTTIDIRFKKVFRGLKEKNQKLVRQSFGGRNDIYCVQGKLIDMTEAEWRLLHEFGVFEIR